jgi:TetR/AcrR family transcriptional regulator, cholesterol catabolism regulator
VETSRRDELLQLAARIFAERGYATTTIRDIAADANILSGSLYHHFESKESMVDEILRPYFLEFDALLADVSKQKTPVIERTSRLILDALRLASQYRDAALIYSHDAVVLRSLFPYIVDTLERHEKVWLKLLRSGARDGTFVAGLDPAVVQRTIIGATAHTTQWFRPGGPLTIEQVAEMQTRIFFNGLVAR